MLGRSIPLVLAIGSLLVIDFSETQTTCPRGTPLSRSCNPFTFPSTCPSEYYCYGSTEASGHCCPVSVTITCPSGGNPTGWCWPFGTNQCPLGHVCTSTSANEFGTCCPVDQQTEMPLPNCRNGGTPHGRCVENACPTGFVCQDAPGVSTGICCGTEMPQPTCPSGGTPLGNCVQNACPAGFYCQYAPGVSTGICCGNQ
ncbi:hypothetical protein CHS0354_018089 [Potamilus streckersoni]|uniref:Uncharacterized protein n=1 Tax=Potamilus streckersoni TaxID=2493646 RepID=A0AAE0TJL1_9BIVA|nr:hypothetical protein CHS0354_018089 [Potamilus streckersoni]